MVLYFPGSVTTHDSVWTTLWFWGGSLNFSFKSAVFYCIVKSPFKTRWHILLGRVSFFQWTPIFLPPSSSPGQNTSLIFPKRCLSKTATSGQSPPFVSPLMVSWSNRLSAFVSVDPLGACHLPGRNDFHLCSATARPAAFWSFSSILQQILSSNNSSVLALAVFRFFLTYFWAK